MVRHKPDGSLENCEGPGIRLKDDKAARKKKPKPDAGNDVIDTTLHKRDPDDDGDDGGSDDFKRGGYYHGNPFKGMSPKQAGSRLAGLF